MPNPFSGRTEFEIREIELEDDANANIGGNITFSYANPSIANDASGRFAKHEIIGGTTVRQKIGEGPLNISINGVCDEKTAAQIDALRDAKNGKLFNDRFNGGSIVVQFGSTSTQPISEGGGVDLESGEFLYTYNINCIEIIR